MKKWIYSLVLMGILVNVAFVADMPPPVVPVAPYFNGSFPSKTPGVHGSWELVDYAPDNIVASPIKFIDHPTDSSLFILSKIGEVWEMDLDSKAQRKLLDIKDRCFGRGEAGAVGMALHPKFGSEQKYNLLFLYYRHKPEPTKWEERGFNRLSKFTWNETERIFEADSEEVLIQQYDLSTWHNGGGLFFGNDGFLYLGVGDEGNWDDPHIDINTSTQNIDFGFFSGILRIDVDNDPARSHPIRRQPQHGYNAPGGWGETYSQGYGIPFNNPWQSPDSQYLEEFIVIGLRNPYSLDYDRTEGVIWGSDVGSSIIEEVNEIEIGDNLQWPYMEGFTPSTRYQKPDSLIGNDKPPTFTYPRSLGSAVVGAEYYRGQLYPQLHDKVLFADYVSQKVLAKNPHDSSEVQVLISHVGNFGIDLPEKYGIAGITALQNGEVLVPVISHDFFESGKILALKNKEVVPDPAGRLSELGVFADMQTRQPAPEFIPYSVNSPLWSDHAIKTRYLSIPNDGDFDQSEEKIDFRANDPWSFPEGTVFMKHFDLQIDQSDPGSRIPLETRFYVVGEDGVPYGLTYKWDSSGTEAFLQVGGSSQEISVLDNGVHMYDQTWDFPSRNDCNTCHNAQANYILGVNTHQLNKNQFYPELNDEVNQLNYLNNLNVFQQNISGAGSYLRSYPLDDASIPLEFRIKSYLDANCSFCHKYGGSVPTTEMDLRYHIPLMGQQMVNAETKSMASELETIVTPGNHRTSELWVRDNSLSENRMPPLASNVVDQMYVDSLAKWIDQLTIKPQPVFSVQLSPNPASELVYLTLGSGWLSAGNLSIYDQTGRLINEQVLNSEFEILDFSDLPAGMYFLSLESGNRQETLKLIIR